MKATNKFYLMQVDQDIVSPLGFRYNLHTLTGKGMLEEGDCFLL